ncbi:hypothetical protein [Nannocystis pusilla]|uniref:hypothetical protein n=1 Tax=Nannocystis pusilla TaxID=889268 RepID=UPI003B7EB27F
MGSSVVLVGPSVVPVVVVPVVGSVGAVGAASVPGKLLGLFVSPPVVAPSVSPGVGAPDEQAPRSSRAGRRRIGGRSMRADDSNTPRDETASAPAR